MIFCIKQVAMPHNVNTVGQTDDWKRRARVTVE